MGYLNYPTQNTCVARINPISSFIKILLPKVLRSLICVALAQAVLLICIFNSIHELSFYFLFFHNKKKESIFYNEKEDIQYYLWLVKCHDIAFDHIMMGISNCIYYFF